MSLMITRDHVKTTTPKHPTGPTPYSFCTSQDLVVVKIRWTLLLHASSTDDGTHSALCSVLDGRVLMYLALVVTQSSLRDGADISLLALRSGRVIRRKDTRDGANNRANGLIESLVFRLADNILQSWAGVCIAEILSTGVGDARVLVEVMMVISGGVGDWADLARRIHVEIWVRRREDSVCSANNGADLCGGSHDSGEMRCRGVCKCVNLMDIRNSRGRGRLYLFAYLCFFKSIPAIH